MRVKLVNLNIQQNLNSIFPIYSSFQTPDHNKKIQTIDDIDNINIKMRGDVQEEQHGNVKRCKKIENYKNNVCWLCTFIDMNLLVFSRLFNGIVQHFRS